MTGPASKKFSAGAASSASTCQFDERTGLRQ